MHKASRLWKPHGDIPSPNTHIIVALDENHAWLCEVPSQRKGIRRMAKLADTPLANTSPAPVGSSLNTSNVFGFLRLMSTLKFYLQLCCQIAVIGFLLYRLIKHDVLMLNDPSVHFLTLLD